MQHCFVPSVQGLTEQLERRVVSWNNVRTFLGQKVICQAQVCRSCQHRVPVVINNTHCTLNTITSVT